MLCSGEKYKHTVFGSSGFHTLERSHPAPAPAPRTVHSAIVRITDSLQAGATGWSRGGQWGRERHPLTVGTWQGGVFTTPMPMRAATRLRLLSADGSVTKETALGKLTLRCKKPSQTFPRTTPPRGGSAKGIAEGLCVNPTSPLTVSHGQHSCALARGRNGVLWPHKVTQPSPTKRWATGADHRALDDIQCNKRIYQLISKSVQQNMNDTKQSMVAAKQIPQSQNVVLSANVKRVELYGVKFSGTRANSRNAHCKYTSNPAVSQSSDSHTETQHHNTLLSTQQHYQPEEETKSDFVTLKQQGHCSLTKGNPPFDPEQAINIPTAQPMN